jgi:PAS domain S-box-containing protein
MKSISSKLLVLIGGVAVIFAVVLFYTSYTTTRNRIYEVIENQVSLALKFDLAIRQYVADHIRPVMYSLVEEDEFIPEAMSTSYIARSIFDEVRTEFPEYIIKFSSDNPRNPINQAGPEELEIIRLFNENPDLKRWEGKITIQGTLYMAKFNARRMTESCTLCHGDSADAPASIIEKYGDKAGFNHPMGRVIGMDTVAIPITKVSEMFWSELRQTFIFSLIGLSLFFLAVFLVIKFFIINRLQLISRHFADAVTSDDYTGIRPITLSGRDEISDLALGFNTLTERLREFYISLDDKVRQRTETLEIVNRQLYQEIRDRKKTEQALRESEERFRTLHNASFGGIAIHDQGIILDCNQGLSDLTGYSRDELIGKNGLSLIAQEWREDTVAKVYDKIEIPYEVEGIRKDGTRYPLRIHAKSIPYQDKMVRVTELRDITESKQAEQEKINAQKIAGEQKQLAMVGQVSGKIAHDFNNLLGVIMGNAELSLMNCTDDKMTKRLALIHKQTERGKNLTRNLMAFARSQDPKQDYFRLKDKIDMVTSLLKKDLAGISLVRDDDPDSPELLADPGMIEHALVNLLLNAVHALSRTEEPVLLIRTFSLGETIGFSVEDNGCGIPEEYLEQIYEPSFSLKGDRDTLDLYDKEVQGTGYGMANVKKYVKQHKGDIKVTSTLGKGTIFTVTFPVIRKQLSAEEQAAIDTPELVTGKHILLVEDEAAISDVQTTILTEPPCCHRVDATPQAKEAIRLFDENTYDLVSLDYILLDNESGMDVYHRIRKANTRIPVIFVSGNIEFLESLQTLTRNDPLVGHLSKPVTNTEYVGLVNRMLLKAAGG